MGWRRGPARQDGGAGGDCQYAAFGHCFGGVEDQIEKRLFELRRFARHRRQIRLKVSHQLGVLVFELVPHQQGQFVHQFVEIDRRQLRLSRAGEIKNLLHDCVQVLNLLVNDSGVLGSRIAGRKLQVQRMVQHLHHRERVADFMRDLGGEQAKSGKLFVLAQLLLDVHHPLVEPGLLDGNGRQLGQRAENADLFIGKTVGLARING